jgi:hypothetical protein
MRTTLARLAAASILVVAAGVSQVKAAPIPAGLGKASAALKSAVSVRYRRHARGRHVRGRHHVRRYWRSPSYAYGYYPYDAYDAYGYYPYRRYYYAPGPYFGIGFGPFRFGFW